MQISEGNLAWAAILLAVVTYDVWALLNRRETLSGAFDKAMSSPRSSATVAVWAALTAHLFDPAVRRAIQRKQQQ